jgi:hypothetical protein
VEERIVLYSLKGFQFPVRIIDTRQIYGRDEVRITPVNGSGVAWVNINKLSSENQQREEVK